MGEGSSAGPIGEYLEVIDSIRPAGASTRRSISTIRALAQDGLPPSEADPAVPPADGVRGGHDAPSSISSGRLGRVAVWAPHRFRVKDGHRDRRVRAAAACLSARAPAAERLYSPDRRRCCSAISRRPRTPVGCRTEWCSPAFRTTLWRTRPRMRCSTACIAVPRADQPGRSRVSRSLRRHRRAVPALHAARGAPGIRSTGRAGISASENLLAPAGGQFGQARTATTARCATQSERSSGGEYVEACAAGTDQLRSEQGTARPGRLVCRGLRGLPPIYKARTADLTAAGDRAEPASCARAISCGSRGSPGRRGRQGREPRSRMCIRALDYCPPIDITFGDYLRALITADRDLVPDDPRNYRVAFVAAFRDRGIYPSGVRNLSPDNLVWESPPLPLENLKGILSKLDLNWSLDGAAARPTTPRTGTPQSSTTG